MLRMMPRAPHLARAVPVAGVALSLLLSVALLALFAPDPATAATSCAKPRGITYLRVTRTSCHTGRTVASRARGGGGARIRAGGRVWRCRFLPNFTARCVAGRARIVFGIFDGPA